MTISRSFITGIFVMMVFTSGCWQGFKLALEKPLWTDEIYSQLSSVQGKSWSEIWTGKIKEGNNSPIFYSVQKLICAVTGWHSDFLWQKQERRDRVVMRFAPVVCMSAGLAIIVGYFTAVYSMIGGLVAFVLCVTSFMVWTFWAEARPYAMMFTMSAIQALLIFQYYRKENVRVLWGLGVVNIVLAFLSSLSVIQIFASGLVIALKGCCRIWLLALTVGIPLAIAFFYYSRADHYSFWFASHGLPLSLIKANMSSERLVAFFVIPCLIWVWDRRSGASGTPAFLSLVVWAWLTFLGYCLLLGVLWIKQNPPEGFEISNRYFMTLTSVGIVAVAAGIMELLQRPRSVLAVCMVWGVILLVIAPRLVKTLHWMGL